MKKFLLLGVTLFLSVAAFAVETELLINGEKVDKVVTQITFEGDNVLLHFGDDTTLYDMESVVLNFKSSSDIDDINFVEFSGNVDSCLTVDGLSDGAKVYVYDARGILCAEAQAECSRAEVRTADLAPGVYILQAEKNCIKFVKR